MSRKAIPKCKKCRREGTKLFLKGERCNTAKCAVVKKNYAPGIHGQKMAGSRLTGYGKQLREKQKAKKSYNLSEKQFRNYFDKAIAKKGDTGQHLLNLLEVRLDIAVYRLGWGKSLSQSRQLVNHGHFLVNDKKVNIPSYLLKVNDSITIREKSLNQKVFADLSERLKNKQIADWLFYDKKEKKAKLVGLPDAKKVMLPFDMTAIIEFYSR